jgi:hypothetical protein
MPTHLTRIERSAMSEIEPFDTAFNESQEFFAYG